MDALLPACRLFMYICRINLDEETLILPCLGLEGTYESIQIDTNLTMFRFEAPDTIISHAAHDKVQWLMSPLLLRNN